MEKYDAIVVGAGMGGLSLAAMLANENKKILCIDKDYNHKKGGRAYVEYEKHKGSVFRLDNGIHLLRYGPHGAYAKVFELAGIGEKFIHNAKPLGLTIFDNERFYKLSEGSMPSLLKADLCPVGKGKLFYQFVKLFFKDIENYYSKPLDEFLKEEKILKCDSLTRVFKALSIAMISCPDTKTASAGELLHHIQLVLKYRFGACYPKGGMSSIIAPLEEKIKEQSVIIKDEVVQYIPTYQGKLQDKDYFDGGQIACKSGKVFFAKNIIFALPAYELLALLGQSSYLIDKNYLDKCKLKPTKGLIVDIGLGTKEYETDKIIVTINPPGLGFFPSSIDNSVAPKGKSLFTFLAFAEKENKELKSSVEQLLDSMFPKITEKTLFKKERFSIVDGAELNINQTYHQRPQNKVPGIEGLYLVGDTTNAHGTGGELACESAIVCAKEILGKDPTTNYQLTTYSLPQVVHH